MSKTLLIILIAILALSTSLLSRNVYIQSKRCESCKFKKIDTLKLPGPSDLSLKINCRETEKYQAFYYDIVNSYSILGKITLLNDSTIKHIDFRILDIAKCNRFHIKQVTYNPSHELHKFNFTINNKKDKPCNSNRAVNRLIPVQSGENVAVIIKSDNDSRIETKEIIIDDGTTEKIYPPFICYGTIY